MHQPSRFRRGFLIILALLCAAFLLLTGLLIRQYLDHRARLEQNAFASAKTQASDAALEINRVFGRLMNIASDIANDLTFGDLEYTEVQDRLRREVQRRPDIDGLAVTFEPFAYDPDERLYQFYVYQQDDGTFGELDGASYDYSQPPTDAPDSPQTAWYHGPLNNGPMWNEPFFATGAQRILIEYGVPFFREDPATGQRVPAGVVTIDYSLRGMRDLISGLELGSTGYGLVLSGNGTFLAYPVQEYVATTTIFELAEANNDTALAEAAARAVDGESFSLATESLITNETIWFFFQPVTTTGWSLGVALNSLEFLPDARTDIQGQVAIALSSGVFVVLAAALVLRIDRGERWSLWGLVLVFSAGATGIIILTWLLASAHQTENGIRVTNQTEVNRYLQSYLPPPAQPQPFVRVPTGVQVQAIHFPDATSVTVNGYIWQRYHDDLDIERGFMLPQRIGEEVTIEEISRERQGDEEVIVWYIGVTLRQDFDTSSFPFDARDITLRLTPLELNQHVVLVPDFDAYPLVTPHLLPGLDEDAQINNWTIESSAFHYRTIHYDASLGLTQRAARNITPELHFVIQTRRNFLGPFIAYLLPGVVAAGMVFAFMLSDRKPGDREEIVTALNYAAALFFVIAVTHTALRDNIAAEGITYMEHLYILLYVAILAVAFNTFLIAKRPDMLIVSYQGNLLSKLLYWPLLVGLLLLSSLLIFVYA